MSGGQTRRYYVDGGFVQVADNVVSVLTNRAVAGRARSTPPWPASNWPQARGRKANSDELMAIRDRLEQQARAQLRLATSGSHSH